MDNQDVEMRLIAATQKSIALQRLAQTLEDRVMWLESATGKASTQEVAQVLARFPYQPCETDVSVRIVKTNKKSIALASLVRKLENRIISVESHVCAKPETQKSACLSFIQKVAGCCSCLSFISKVGGCCSSEEAMRRGGMPLVLVERLLQRKQDQAEASLLQREEAHAKQFHQHVTETSCLRYKLNRVSTDYAESVKAYELQLQQCSERDAFHLCTISDLQAQLSAQAAEAQQQKVTPLAFRISEKGNRKVRSQVIMNHTPLIRFDNSTEGNLQIPAEAQSLLQSLDPPVRVLAFVGPGRTGKSTLAGNIVGEEFLFPSARSTGPVTEGINAAAVRHPSGGSLIILDGEGFDNPLAPSSLPVPLVLHTYPSSNFQAQSHEGNHTMSRKSEILLEVECESIDEFRKKIAHKIAKLKGSDPHDRLKFKQRQTLQKEEKLLKELEDIEANEELVLSCKSEILLEVECESLEEFRSEVAKKRASLQEKKRNGTNEALLKKLTASLTRQEELLQEIEALEPTEDAISTDGGTQEVQSTTPSASHDASLESSPPVLECRDEEIPEPPQIYHMPETGCVALDAGVSEILHEAEASEASRDDVPIAGVPMAQPSKDDDVKCSPNTASMQHDSEAPPPPPPPPTASMQHDSEEFNSQDASRSVSFCYGSPIIDLHKVVAGIKDHQRNSANCKNKAAAFVLGTTGVGKTTMLCWVLGKSPKMQKEKQVIKGRERVVDVMVVENAPEGLVVGHNKFKSQTRYLRSYQDPEIELVWVDTPGWGDVEGSEVDIANAVGITHTIHSCQSVRPILLVSAKALPTERGRYLRSLLGLVTRFFNQDTFKEGIEALQVLFTHVADGQTSEDLWFLFNEFLEEEKSSPEVVCFIQHVSALLDNHGNTMLLRPTQHTATALKNVVQSARPIKNVEEVFGSPLSDADRTKLNVACDQLVQDVIDSLRDLEFGNLQKVLDTLHLLQKMSKVPMIKAAYKNAGKRVLNDFHGKLTAAFRSFEKNNFEPTRQQLENISDDLLVHTSELEKEEETSNPGFQSIRRRRENLVIHINTEMENLRISSLQEHGSEDFHEVHRKLGMMQKMSTILHSQLFEENQSIYAESAKVLENRIIEYKEQAENLFEMRNLGIADDAVNCVVHPSRNSAVKALMDLASSMVGLRDASLAGKDHLQDELLNYHDEQVTKLEVRAVECHSQFSHKLWSLEDTDQEIDVNAWVNDISSILLLPWAIHDALSDHVPKECANMYLNCLQMLEEREVQISGSFDKSLASHDFKAVAVYLCQFDFIRQVCHSKLVGQRFKDRHARAICVVESLAIEIHRWLSKAGSRESYERVSCDLDLLRQACKVLTRYLENGRSACSLAKQETQPSPSCTEIDPSISSPSCTEIDPSVSYVASAELAKLCNHFLDKLTAHVKESLELAISLMGVNDYHALDKCISQLDQMWPLHVHVADMEKNYQQFACKMQCHAKDLCQIAQESSNPTVANFEPMRIKELLTLIAALLKLLQVHQKGCISEMFASIPEKFAPVQELDRARQDVLSNIHLRVTFLEASALSKIEGSHFEAPIEEFTLLKSINALLSTEIGERTGALQFLIGKADKLLSCCEDKFQEALAEENLQAAEQINTGIVQRMLSLQGFMSRVETVASRMQRELVGRKDSFVLKVNDLLDKGLYPDVTPVMHGAKQQLQGGTPEDAKRWRDALASVIGHFYPKYEGAQMVLREARMSSPLNLDGGSHSFSRVVEFMRRLNSIKECDAHGACLASLLPDYENWCLGLAQEVRNLLGRIASDGNRSLSKWKFSDMPRIRANLMHVSHVQGFGEECEKEQQKLDEAIEKKVEGLSTELNSMIGYGYTPGCTDDPLKCTCHKCEFQCQVRPSRIDHLLDGVHAAFESDLPHDFDQIYEVLKIALGKQVGNLYNAAKTFLRQGKVEAAEALMCATELLQSSASVSKKTMFNPDRHIKLLGELASRKEEFLTRPRAQQDPAGFKRQLQELKDNDYTTYRQMFKPLKDEMLAERQNLSQQISHLYAYEEDKLEPIIAGLRNQHLYESAIEGHDETDLRVPELLRDMKKALDRAAAAADKAQESSQVHEIETSSSFLLAAIDNLKTTKISALQDLAASFEPQHAELVKRMNESLNETRANWKLVEDLDLCKDNPPMSNLVAYMNRLQSSKICIPGAEGRQLSFQIACIVVFQKFESLDVDSLWSECATPMKGGKAARLAIALTNLQSLAREFPALVTPASHKAFIDEVCKRKASSQDQILNKFKHVRRSIISDAEEKTEWKEINKLMEDCVQIKRVLGGISDIFPPGEEDRIVECMKNSVSDDHSKKTADIQDLDSVAQHIVSIFKVASYLSNPAIGTHVRSIIGSFLATLRRNKIDFGVLGSNLCAASAVGGQIVEEFDEFRQFKLDLFKNKTAGMSFNHAIDQLVRDNNIPAEQQQRLAACFQSYENRYQALLNEHMFKGLEGLYDEVKRCFHAYRNTTATSTQVPELLAGICAAVALIMSDLPTGAASDLVNRKSSMMHPHAVQVIALLRLLRADHPPQSWASATWKLIVGGGEIGQSHLIQIGTGEGKSIALGVLSIFMALCGYAVDCVCYSKYLSLRDCAAFKDLFVGFGVDGLIHYGTFGELARRHVNQAGDVRIGTQALVNGKLEQGTIKPSRACEKILLIDEVDVFFSLDFYGALYRPSVLIQGPEITELLTFIWESRGPSLTLQSVRSSPAFQKVAQRFFPRLQDVIESHVTAMVHATTTFDKPEHSYEVEGGRIGYVEHGTVNTTLRHGYNTTFSYFQELERGKISQSTFDEFMGLEVRCGSFSYAEIPHAYKRILGVTGTLKSLGKFEQSVIRDVYKISEQTITPSMYGVRDTNFDKGVHVEFGINSYHRKILDEINDLVAAKRAVLVFFENDGAIEDFQNSEYGQRLNNVSAVKSCNGEYIHHYVKQATRSNEVTLLHKVFGRGLDFACYDKVVAAGGGVAVLQTFLSEDISEEIQIQGRTCRQGEKGSYKMILLAEDLIGWNEAKADASHRKPDGTLATGPVRAPFVTKGELEKNAGPGLKTLLDQKRIMWFTEQSFKRQSIVNAAREQHDSSSKYQQFLCNFTKSQDANVISMLSDMNRGLQPSSRCHSVFCLDESYSMSGHRWAQLTKAFAAFVQVCINNGDTGDKISVVQFADYARVTLRQTSLEKASQCTLEMEPGGTRFQPALETALNLFRNTPSLKPVLVFMSDGENSDSDATSAYLKNMSDQLKNLQCHMVFFGRESGSDNLKKLAQSVPGGKFHLSVDGLELQRTFSSIAADVTAL